MGLSGARGGGGVVGGCGGGAAVLWQTASQPDGFKSWYETDRREHVSCHLTARRSHL